MRHQIHFLIGGYRGVTAVLTCESDLGAKCRMECAENCAMAEEGYGCACKQRPNEECSIPPWLENNDDPVQDQYGGPLTQLRSGPVKFEWIDWGYEWEYEEETASE